MELERKTKLEDFLLEVQIGKDERVNNLFNIALKQAFSAAFVNKIEEKLKKRIRIKEIYGKNKEVIAFNRGNAIYLEKSNFDKLPIKKRIQFLLHEFIHILQRKKKLGVFGAFKDIDDVNIALDKVLSRHLKSPKEIFLTGRNVKLGGGARNEILSYLMNDSIKWDLLPPEGKKEFVDVVKNSQIFNINHPFWKARLPR
jgi:predicted metallopeptidase